MNLKYEKEAFNAADFFASLVDEHLKGNDRFIVKIWQKLHPGMLKFSLLQIQLNQAHSANSTKALNGSGESIFFIQADAFTLSHFSAPRWTHIEACFLSTDCQRGALNVEFTLML